MEQVIKLLCNRAVKNGPRALFLINGELHDMPADSQKALQQNIRTLVGVYNSKVKPDHVREDVAYMLQRKT